MNCLAARKSFVAIWTKQLGLDERQELLSHLGSCNACDRSFRIFALSAPLLHGDPASPQLLRRHAEVRPEVIKGPRVGSSSAWPKKDYRWALAAAALAMSAAAALTLYISRPAAPTLEDAILQNVTADSDPDVHLTNYGGAPLFAPQDANSGFDFPDLGAQPDQSSQNGLAG